MAASLVISDPKMKNKLQKLRNDLIKCYTVLDQPITYIPVQVGVIWLDRKATVNGNARNLLPPPLRRTAQVSEFTEIGRRLQILRRDPKRAS